MYHYLQGEEERSWLPDCSAGAPSAESRLTRSVGGCCCNDSAMDSWDGFRSGTTSEPSQEPIGQRTLSAPAGHARTYQPQERAQESTESGLDYGVRLPGCFATYDRDTHSWKTRQLSLLEGLTKFSGTWPRSGLMLHGECMARAQQELRTAETDGGALPDLPTPTANYYGTTNNGEKNGKPYKTKGKPSLWTMARRGEWPDRRLAGGPLSPMWIAWLMGWPIGWTDSEPLATGRFRQWLRLHGDN